MDQAGFKGNLGISKIRVFSLEICLKLWTISLNILNSCKRFLRLSVQSTQFCSLLLLLYCICVDK